VIFFLIFAVMFIQSSGEPDETGIVTLVIYFLTTQATLNAFRLYTTQNSQL
jgi:hypothetical protein